MKTLEKTRLEARITPQQKELFSRAAAVSGMSLTDFVKTALIEKANDTLQKHDVIQLCMEDQQQLADHLINPPKTPAKFKRLVNWSKKNS